jgi:hypothetical protein
VENWLKRTAAYIPTWIDYQLRSTNQVGCLLAFDRHGLVGSMGRRGNPYDCESVGAAWRA